MARSGRHEPAPALTLTFPWKARPRNRAAPTALLAHVGAAVAFLAGTTCSMLPSIVPVAFAPALARLIRYLRLPRSELPPRQLGWREVTLSALFAAGSSGFARLP